LIHKRPRAATIIAKSDCVFAVMNKATYQKILLKKHKEELEEKSKFIQSIPFFRNWSNLALSKFSYFFVEKQFRRNQAVYQEGDKIDSIFVIREGEFEVVRKTQFERENKIPDTSQFLAPDPRESRQGRRLFNKPVRMSHLMEQNSHSQFQKYMSK